MGLHAADRKPMRQRIEGHSHDGVHVFGLSIVAKIPVTVSADGTCLVVFVLFCGEGRDGAITLRN